MVKYKRLAAIIFTDLVGFSKLANTNEAKALELIEINRQHQKPIIKKYGTFVKEIGDGMLAKFRSAFDAVACAVEIQNNAPPTLSNKIRIGIHLGDITEENSDVFGDGVNLASRLESIAEPGTIYISDSVYNAIRSIDDIEAEFVGDKELKNIANPVKCYKVLGIKSGGKLKPSKRPAFNKHLVTFLLFAVIVVVSVLIVTKRKNTIDNPIIAVLPMKIIGDDAELKYFASGVVESLTHMLSKAGITKQAFSVIPSSEILKAITADEARKKFKVSLDISGSIQKDQKSIRIILNLINAKKKNVIKSEKLDYATNKNLIIQDEIISVMVSMLGFKLEQEPKVQFAQGGSSLNVANELFLIGRRIFREGVESLESIDKALEYFHEAVEQDSLFALAYAGIAQAYTLKYHFTLDPA